MEKNFVDWFFTEGEADPEGFYLPPEERWKPRSEDYSWQQDPTYTPEDPSEYPWHRNPWSDSDELW